MRLVLLGMRCAFSRIPFEAVWRAGYSVAALIIPSAAGRTGPLPAPDLPLWARDVVGLAHSQGTPVWEVAALRAPAALAMLEAIRPEVVVAACFPWLVPPAWLRRLPMGGLNLHPSHLPAYRGPEPLFWQFRQGEPNPGVTLHWMDAGADTGPIIAQRAVAFPDGLTYAEAEAETATAGAALLVAALGRLRDQGREALAGTPQPVAGPTPAPRPTPADLHLPADWPARRAFNFVRGAEPYGPFTAEAPHGRVQVSAALAWRPAGAAFTAPPTPHEIDLPFRDGAVRCRRAPHS